MAVDVSSTPPPSVTEINACVSPQNSHRPAGKDTTFREWFVVNQIGISLTIFAMLLAVHNLYPSLRPYTTPFFGMSYYQSNGVYVQGLNDIPFVVSAIIAFTAIRAIAIEWAFQPLAQSLGLKRKAAIRVAEQAWMFVYYAFFWTFGMYIWSQSPYWLDFGAVWGKWPERGVSGSLKWYLLVQLAFWVQQIIVINIEERRKDHYQMLTHHLITSTLLGSAYIYGFYNVSNVVLCLMDLVDLLLPGAKILKYLKYQTSCNVAFGVFMVAWLISRHICYPLLCWSIYQTLPGTLSGCFSGATAEMISIDGYPNKFAYLFSPFFNIDGPICMNRTVKWIFLSFLLALQVLSIIWFTMVIRVAVKTLRTGSAEDTRSDGEEEEEVSTNGQVHAAGKEGANGTAVTVDSTNPEWQRSNRPSTVRARGRGRVRLEQSDRKALLGRIGCDKPS